MCIRDSAIAASARGRARRAGLSAGAAGAPHEGLADAIVAPGDTQVAGASLATKRPSSSQRMGNATRVTRVRGLMDKEGKPYRVPKDTCPTQGGFEVALAAQPRPVCPSTPTVALHLESPT